MARVTLKNKDDQNLPSDPSSHKHWLHSPESLQKGHIAYLVKFLGSTEVDQPKGIEIVKEGIRKLKFTQQLKKAEGNKTPKVELTISIDGVAIHEPKTKRNLHQYPLHRISYCADDKAEKRFFSFIAKEANSDKHTCYVFVSDKLAEEITLTIGQAFELAYLRFVQTSGRELELRKQVLTLQKRTQILEEENTSLKSRISQLATLKTRPDLELFLKEHEYNEILDLHEEENNSDAASSGFHSSPHTSSTPPSIPPHNLLSNSDDSFFDQSSTQESEDDFNPRAEEEINSFHNNNEIEHETDDDFDPRAEEKKPPSFSQNFVEFESPISKTNGVAKSHLPLIPPPRPSRPHEVAKINNNIFDVSSDPFATESFPPLNANNGDILSQFNEMKDGFSRGISFGTSDDFSLESLDPLKN